MVLGLRSRHRKGASIQVDYLVHLREIKPWPPSQSLRSVQSVLLQWENGDQISGSLSCGVGDANIEFNESFTLPLTLTREKRAHDKFQKNCLEFHLYEPRKDKAGKGQLLGTVIINLADYGIIEENLTVNAPVNCKKSSKNMIQPILFVKIEPIDKDSSNLSPKGSLSKKVSLDKGRQESVSELTHEENDDESEIASFTDDDVSSHSSRTIASSTLEAAGASPHQNEKDGSESAIESTEKGNGEPAPPLGVELSTPLINQGTEAFKQPTKSKHILSSMDLSSNLENPANNHAYLSNYPERDMTSIRKVSVTPSVQSFSSSTVHREANEESKTHMRSFEQENMSDDFRESIADSKGKIEENIQKSGKDKFVDRISAKTASSDTYIHVGVNSDIASHRESQPPSGDDDGQASHWRKNGQMEAITINDVYIDPWDGKEKREQQEIEQDEHNLNQMRQSLENRKVGKFSNDATRKQGTLRSNTLLSSRTATGVQDTAVNNSKLKHMNSVQLPSDSAMANRFPRKIHNIEKVKQIDFLEAAQNNISSDAATGKKEPPNGSSDNRTEWKSRVEMLEEELREAAAIEVGLYSIVAEHGSSINKVHTSARRLSRFYLHAFKARSHDKRASAARATVSGLVLVSKTCGNDVPRLTFWLSNSLMLRAIISQAVGETPLSDGPCAKNNGGGRGSDGRSPRKCNDSSSLGEEKIDSTEEFDDWEDPKTFTIALEKVEAWIFSRIIESVWWQILTPHMQSTAAKSTRSLSSSSRKNNGNKNVLGDQEQGNFSVDLWKKAFRDACERLCPIRAGGHECGCLPVARLVMEQLVSRLDVAMFNAILRESAEEMPTDPVSDPIGDSKVLPIPAGRSSFGAGAQLKNAIGNWSRWLTDLFDIEDNDFPEDNNDLDDDKRLEFDTSFKAFRLLHALSDLMMLPFEMLADASIRKEVCPTFGTPLIKRVVNNFVPDEFCPHPIPDAVIEALDSEDALEVDEVCLTSFPCMATPIVYSPPLAASLAGIIGEVGSHALQRSGSSVLKKSYTSDDELDELDTPLTSVITDTLRVSTTLTRPNWMPKGKGSRNIVRYQLLREVWRDGE